MFLNSVKSNFSNKGKVTVTTLCIYSRLRSKELLHILGKEKNIFTEEMVAFKHKFKALYNIFMMFGEIQ